ncbi:MAG: diacylglycerol kinase family protein [Bacteroidota bacterium]
MNNNWKVIINPHAGGNTDSSVLQRILSELENANIHFDHEESLYHRHIIEIASKSIINGYRKFIIIGGDGSLNELVNGIYNQSTANPDEITAALISLGTGNDWPKTHGLPKESKQMIERIKAGTTSLQDVGVVRYHYNTEIRTNYFVNVAGMGFDAFVVMNTAKKKGKKPRSKFSYLYSLFRSLLRYSCVKAKICVNGKEVFHNYLFSFNAGIGRYSGGGMMQAPEAIPDDGLLDVTVFRKMSKAKVIANVKRLYDGSFKNLPEVSLYKGQEVQIQSDKSILLECDGEVLGHSPALFTIIPSGFRYIC